MEYNNINYSNSSLKLDISTQQDNDISTVVEIPLYNYITVSMFNALIFLLGTIGNTFVIIVIIKVKNMWTPTNVYLLNLSFADIVVLLICQPSGLLEFFGKDRWFLGKVMCKVVPLLEHGSLNVSVLTMLAVTLERYKALCHPLKCHVTSTISAAVKSSIAIWTTGFIITLPWLIMTEYEDAIFYDGSPIKVCRTKVDEMWRYLYTLLIFSLFFALPFFIMVILYACIIRRLMSDKLKSLAENNRTAVKTFQSRMQVVQMLVFIIVMCFLLLFPIRVFSLWLIFAQTTDVIKLGFEWYINLISLVRILMYINSAVNPIIYSLTSTKFKLAFRNILRCNSGRVQFQGISSSNYTSRRTINQTHC